MLLCLTEVVCPHGKGEPDFRAENVPVGNMLGHLHWGSCPLQWLGSASWSMGLGCRMLQSSQCAALMLKGGKRIEMGFREFILETILIISECIWFAVFRLFWMVQLVQLWQSFWGEALFFYCQTSPASRQGPGSPEAPEETSMVHRVVLKVDQRCFNVERWA